MRKCFAEGFDTYGEWGITGFLRCYRCDICYESINPIDFKGNYSVTPVES